MFSFLKNLVSIPHKNPNEANGVFEAQPGKNGRSLSIPQNQNRSSASLNSKNIKKVGNFSFMQKLGQAAFMALEQTHSWFERKSELSRLGKEILHRGASGIDVNWRQFSHMHNGLLIPNTSLEGGVLRSSIKTWSDFFLKWKKEGNPFFDVKLPSQTIGDVGDELNSLQDFSYLIPDGRDEPLEKNELEQTVANIRGTLLKKLKKDGVAYLPLGYRHGVTNQGHEIIVKIEQKKNSIHIAIINLGNGCDLNPLLDMTPSQTKFSYRYFPIEVSKETFWGEMGQAAFCHLIRYQSDPPSPRCMPYDGSDIYDIFLTLGKPILDLGKDPEKYKAKGQQRSGTCPEKGVKNMVYDLLLESKFNLSPIEVKKVFLNIRFDSLINGYHTYIKNPSRETREQLRNACETFGRNIDKLRNELHETEILGATAVVHEILKQTKMVPTPILPNLNEIIIENSQVEVKRLEIDPSLMKLPKAPHKEPEAFIHGLEKETLISTVIPKKPAAFNPAHFSEQLQEWINLIELNNSQEERFELLSECVKMMPLPVWGEKYLNIPPDEIGDIVQKIEKLLKTALQDVDIGSSSNHFYADQFLVVHSLYMITDALTRQKVVELDQFATPFFPHKMNLMPNEFTSLPLGRDNDTYGQIQNYFSACKKEGKEGEIFPFDHPVLSIEKYNQDGMNGTWGHASGIAHIQFLSRFLHKNLRNAANIRLNEYYLALWQNPKNCDPKSQKFHQLIQMPEEIYTLYYLAFLSFSLFTTRGGWEREKFPQELSFLRKNDVFGKKGLKIKNEKIVSAHPMFILNGVKNFEQFNEMGVSTNFIPIYDEKYQKLSTNQAVTSRIGKGVAAKYQISEPTYRELLRILRKKNLFVHLTLQWATNHLTALEHPGIQKVIDHCFFSPGLLPTRLREAPSLVESLRAFIKKGVEFYKSNPHHLTGILFLLRTGICIETHISTVFGKEKSSATLKEYREILIKLLQVIPQNSDEKTEIIWHLILCETHREPLSDDEIGILYTWVAQLKFMPTPPVNYPWLSKKIPGLIKEFANRLESKFNDDRQFRNKLCNVVFHQLVLKSPEKEQMVFSEGEWVGDFPNFSYSDYGFNLSTSEFSHKEQGKLVKKDFSGYMASVNELKQELFRKHPGNEYWQTGDEKGNIEWVHKNGRLKIILPKDKLSAMCEKKTIDGKEVWCEIVDFHPHEIDRLGLDYLNHSKYLSWIHYMPLDNDNDKSSNIINDDEINTSSDNNNERSILTYNIRKDTPLLRIEEKGSEMVIKKVDENGEILPVELVDLKKIENDPSHPLYQAALRIAKPQHVLCFFNKEKGAIEELDFYYGAKLRFIRGPQGLESVQYPGYIYDPDATLEEINHFKGA